MDKKEIRKQITARRTQVTPAEAKAAGALLCAHVINWKECRRAEQIALFASTPLEPDTWALMKKLLQDGKQLFLPRVEGKQMEFYRTTDLEHFVRSSYGILEPLPGEPLSKDPALFLIPGCAFDLSGGRIGYGGGYYDRYLAARRSIRDLLFGYA